ncbi:MAG TPA: aminomethyl-transferring glycine dehydrogenase subunit GcvPA [bacterium]|nr:aminomethyl-transferring glycine dehydrogenase subunit GcvPA [bacterium]
MSAFVQHTPEDRRKMMEAIGVSSFEELIADIPAEIRAGDLPIAEGLSEPETLARLRSLAARNRSASDLVCFAGGGIYDVCVPAATKAIAGRPEFATAYTPYQAETSQGTLQAIYEFQTFITRLTGMDVANASMYDGATALAEAVVLAMGARAGNRVLVTPFLHPNHRRVLDTILEPAGMKLEELPARGARTDLSGLAAERMGDVAAVVLQHPNRFGVLEDMRLAGAALEGDDAPVFIASVDLASLALVEPPADYGADVAIGEAQSLGIPMSFGGPVAGVFAARKEYLRRIPGRIVGLGKDAEGKRAFTLTFQTREQHIRRAKATSNICTNQALTALQATVSSALLGAEGRRLAATLSAEKAHALAADLAGIRGVELVDPDAEFFREFAVRLPEGLSAPAVVRAMAERGYLAGIALANPPGGGEGLLVAVTENRTWAEIDGYVKRSGPS